MSFFRISTGQLLKFIVWGGVDFPRSFSKYVRSNGWDPVDARLQVSDLPQLVRLLGGRHLYGDNVKVPVRELIQNAADAVRARQLIEDRKSSGKITVRLRSATDGKWIEVEDNGVGMSERILTGSLLDFGKSFWNGEMVNEEFPGLVAKGMRATGKFGIGFFSVFMLGDVVRVTSRRFDDSADTARTLEFRAGLDARPILRPANPVERVKDGGTRVAVKLRANPHSKEGLLASEWQGKVARIPLKSLVGALSPSIDVDVDVDEDGKEYSVVKSNDWSSLPGSKLFRRLFALEGSHKLKRSEWAYYFAHLRELKEDSGEIVGRACIAPSGYFGDIRGVVTVGGLLASQLPHIAGVLHGRAETVTRDYAIPDVSFEALKTWASEQVRLLAESALSDEKKMEAAGTAMACGADPCALPDVVDVDIDAIGEPRNHL
jgi:hypothetical protein